MVAVLREMEPIGARDFVFSQKRSQAGGIVIVELCLPDVNVVNS